MPSPRSLIRRRQRPVGSSGQIQRAFAATQPVAGKPRRKISSFHDRPSFRRRLRGFFRPQRRLRIFLRKGSLTSPRPHRPQLFPHGNHPYQPHRPRLPRLPRLRRAPPGEILTGSRHEQFQRLAPIRAVCRRPAAAHQATSGLYLVQVLDRPRQDMARPRRRARRAADPTRLCGSDPDREHGLIGLHVCAPGFQSSVGMLSPTSSCVSKITGRSTRRISRA